MLLKDLLNSSRMTRETADPAGSGTGDQGQQQQQTGAVSWTTGLDADLIGHAQNRGLHDKPADEAARLSLKAHREAELMLGVPADRIVKLPAPTAPPEEWNAVWAKLGKPADGKYDLSSVKVGDQPLPQADVDWLSQRAAELNLSQDGALKLAQAHVKRQSDAALTVQADTQAKLDAAKAELATSWGQNANANLVIAQQTAMKLGVSPEAVAALEGQIGYAKVMQMFLAIGQKTGEASFVANGQNFNGGVLTKEQAAARMTELKADKAWTERYLNGDVAANRELQALIAITAG